MPRGVNCRASTRVTVLNRLLRGFHPQDGEPLHALTRQAVLDSSVSRSIVRHRVGGKQPAGSDADIYLGIAGAIDHADTDAVSRACGYHLDFDD